MLPIIWKFWDFKVFMRRLTRAKGRKDFDLVKRIRENKPFYKLDHIVKERYPKFVDSLRDIDDALSMCFLYAMFPKSRGLPLELIELCRRLSLEFMLYVIETKSLRKVFISIKGYYYQADIMGQTVTWIVPHQFVFDRIVDVDFSIMKSFVEFYITLIGFVNYKLYSLANLYYPPKTNESRNKLKNDEVLKEDDENMDENDENDETGDSEEQIASLNTPLVMSKNLEIIAKPDQFDEQEGEENEDETIKKSELTFHQVTKLQNLFNGLKFFLNREVPRESLVFVVRSFGGQVSWDKNLFKGATFDEDDETITHQIVDREFINNKILNRYYIQPQWVYDCINARMLLPVEEYFIGEILPPHLSPFVDEKPGDYVPPEKQKLINLQSGVKDETNEENQDEEKDENNQIKIDDKNKKSDSIVRPGHHEKIDKERLGQNLLKEEKRLSTMMIPKKKKRLYDKIMFGKKRKTKEAEKLKAKREQYEMNRKEKIGVKKWTIT